MNNGLYYRNLIIMIIASLVFFYCSVRYWQGGNLFKPERAAAGMKDFVTKNGRLMTTVLYGIVAIMSSVILITGFPLLQDFSNVVNKRYLSISGTAVNQSISGKSTTVEVRSIKLLDENSGEEIRLTFYGRYDTKKGDKLSFYYYPNSKIASYQNPNENKLRK